MTILAMLMFGAVFFALLAIAVSFMADAKVTAEELAAEEQAAATEEDTWIEDTVEGLSELAGDFWDWMTGADDPEEAESDSYDEDPTAYEDQSMQEPYEGYDESEGVNGDLEPGQEDPADEDLTAYEDQSMQEDYEDEDYGESESAY